MIYLELFLNFCKIGLFSIGGGYAVLPLIQQVMVEQMGWLTMSEFADIITISQMTPGPIALNAASFVGLQVGGKIGVIEGIVGASVATAGCVFPSFVIVLFVAFIYYKYRSLSVIDGILYGIRPAVVSLIASAGVGIMALALLSNSRNGYLSLDYIATGIFVAAFVLLRIFGKKLNPIYVILGAGILGVGLYSVI